MGAKRTIFIALLLVFGEQIRAEIKKTLTAKECGELALARSKNFLAVRQDMNAATADIGVASSAFFPRAQFLGSTGTTRSYAQANSTDGSANSALNSAATLHDQNHYRGTLELRQSIFAGGKDYYFYQARDAQRQKSEALLRQTRDQTIAQALGLYFAIQLHQEELRAEKEVQQQRASYLSDMEALLRQGGTTRLNYLQAEYALKSQGPAIREKELALQQKQFELAQMLEISLDQSLELTDSLDAGFAAFSKIKVPDFASAFEQALQNNPDLKIASAAVDQVNAETNQARASHYPSLDFVMQGNIDSERRDEINDLENRKYVIQLELTVPLFSGFESFSSTESRIARQSAAQFRRDFAQQKLLTNLKDIYAKIELNQMRLLAEKVNFSLAEESIKMSENLFKSGRATSTDVLDSYARKLLALQTIAQKKHERIVTILDLQTILGDETRSIHELE